MGQWNEFFPYEEIQYRFGLLQVRVARSGRDDGGSYEGEYLFARLEIVLKHFSFNSFFPHEDMHSFE